MDNCERVCVCRGGRHQECTRIRQEFLHMPKSDRQRYLATVRLISTTEPWKSQYEALLEMHKDLQSSGIDTARLFLPWHRWFLLQYENLLRQINCKLTVPYWDWSLVSEQLFDNEFWNGTASGFGGNGVGDPPCVKTGGCGS